MPPEPADTTLSPPRGYTPNELARVLRVSPDRIRAWIKSGELQAVNVSQHRCSRPRFVVLPHHLAEFERDRQVGPPPKAPRRRKKTAEIDYYPD
jgi:excisionase family DNA binding protein